MLFFQECEDLGELLLSLNYLPSAGRLNCDVIKAKQLLRTDMNSGAGACSTLLMNDFVVYFLFTFSLCLNCIQVTRIKAFVLPTTTALLSNWLSAIDLPKIIVLLDWLTLLLRNTAL